MNNLVCDRRMKSVVDLKTNNNVVLVSIEFNNNMSSDTKIKIIQAINKIINRETKP